MSAFTFASKDILLTKLHQQIPFEHIVWLRADPVALVFLMQFGGKILLLELYNRKADPAKIISMDTIPIVGQGVLSIP